MPQRKSDCRLGQACPASLSIAKSAEAEKVGASGGAGIVRLALGQGEEETNVEAAGAQPRDLTRRIRGRTQPEPRQPARRGRYSTARMGVRNPQRSSDAWDGTRRGGPR